MKLTTLLFLTLLSMGVQADGKLAFINVKLILEKSPQAVAANAELKEEFGERELNFRKLVQEIQQMEKTYQTDGAIMSAEQKKKAEDNIIQKQRRVKFEQQSLKEDLQREQRQLSKQVQSALRAVIQSYGTENGYNFIFTDSNVAFASDAVNITEEILKEMQK